MPAKAAPPTQDVAFADRLALLVVDVQDRALSAVPERKALLRRISFAVEAAGMLGIETLFTEQRPEKLGGVNAELLQLARRKKVFGKTAFSALSAEGVRAALTQKNVEHLLVCGIETQINLYQSILQARSLGLDVTLLSDCHGGRRRDDARIVVRFLERNGVHVLPSETVFYSLLADAKHPEFQAYTQLVKDHAD